MFSIKSVILIFKLTIELYYLIHGSKYFWFNYYKTYLFFYLKKIKKSHLLYLGDKFKVSII